MTHLMTFSQILEEQSSHWKWHDTTSRADYEATVREHHPGARETAKSEGTPMTSHVNEHGVKVAHWDHKAKRGLVRISTNGPAKRPYRRRTTA